MSDAEIENLLVTSTTNSSTEAVCRQKRGVPTKLVQSKRCAMSPSRVFQWICITLILYIVYFIFSNAWPPVERIPQLVVRVPLSDAPGEHIPLHYLVYSPNCHIPSLDPLASDVMKLFERQTYKPCSDQLPLTFIRVNESSGVAHLVVNTTLLGNYKWMTFRASIDRCCYQEILRNGSGKDVDNQFRLGDMNCNPIARDAVQLADTNEFILVRCKSRDKVLYTNSHAIVRQRPDIRKRLDTSRAANPKKRPLSVLMMSIDSISRLNLLRALPKTAQHLYDSGWFELQGYNKMGDNTFPNLMAILNGYNKSTSYGKCDPTKVGRLDTCPFVWKDFQAAGYVTAYGEDETTISSFNYEKLGFQYPPTDYYLRPYMMAAERNLDIHERLHWLTICLGYQNSVDHVYQYALDFAAKYKDDPFFGLFWTNTFSHSDLNDPSQMDDKMLAYLWQMHDRNILNNSAVIFFSDHGVRFGPIRQLATGWLEERLPFIFIWLPPWFRAENPNAVRALKINRNRLTNPYDLHITLKHILNMSGRRKGPLDADACPRCQSFFEEMHPNRSCEHASIEPHWCTCPQYNAQNRSGVLVPSMVEFVVKKLNDDLRTFMKDALAKCAVLRTKGISYARKAEMQSQTSDVYLIVFETSPNNASYEATVEHSLSTGQLTLTGSVSRLNVYGDQGKCMPDDTLRKYCFCLNNG